MPDDFRPGETALPFDPGAAECTHLHFIGPAARQAMILRYWTSDPQRNLIVQSPAHRDGPTWVFALRLLARPNPVASAVVRLLGNDVQAGILRVDALDAFDGTALLDVKPWLPGVHVPPELGH